jgi:hypothetical protein
VSVIASLNHARRIQVDDMEAGQRQDVMPGSNDVFLY